jgi:uracil-DNA glycosylase
VRRNDDLRGELQELVGALKTHIANERDAYNPVSRMVLKGKGLQRRGDVGPEGIPAAPVPAQAAGRKAASSLAGVREELGECTRCPLHRTRKTIVFGEGSPKARLVFVGEAPGEEEDNQGRPFVGRAGQLLTKIIGAMGLQREDVYICNILKCRPPGNRNPKDDEIAACEPFLVKQLEALNPEVICALGTFAAKTLLRTDIPISAMRGKFHDYHGRRLMPTYHPAYLLRNPDAKKLVWEDVQKIMKIL